ncbi:hypothetical protein BHE74_00042484, partial [Ensete ventricosum]
MVQLYGLKAVQLDSIRSAALALDDSILDVDQVENLIKFCPTKEEMELLKVHVTIIPGYTGDKEKLGKCEQVKYPAAVSLVLVYFHTKLTRPN